jgi:hypothetical protein
MTTQCPLSDEEAMPPLFFPIASDDALDALVLDPLALDPPPRIVPVVACHGRPVVELASSALDDKTEPS